MDQKPDKTIPPVAPAPARKASPPSKAADPPAPSRHADEAWQPRIERERELHGFGGKTPEADSILETPQIRNPDEDTAPLQGSHDRSDEDSLEPSE